MQIEPGTSPKHRYELIKASLLVIIGALITITIVYGIEYFSPKPESDTMIVEPVSSTEPVVEDIDTNNQETTTEKVYSQEELNQIFEMDKKSPDTKLFYSERLGVGFTYSLLEGFSPDIYEVPVIEEGNGVSISYPVKKGTPASGRKSLEVFNKDPKDTLEQAITQEFLQGVDTSKCFAQKYTGGDSSEKLQSQFNYAEIFYTPTQQEEVGINNGIENCPEEIQLYAATNAVQFFLEDPKVPSKYLFVRIGQESIAESGMGEDWSSSIRILK